MLSLATTAFTSRVLVSPPRAARTASTAMPTTSRSAPTTMTGLNFLFMLSPSRGSLLAAARRRADGDVAVGGDVALPDEAPDRVGHRAQQAQVDAARDRDLDEVAGDVRRRVARDAGVRGAVGADEDGDHQRLVVRVVAHQLHDLGRGGTAA